MTKQKQPIGTRVEVEAEIFASRSIADLTLLRETLYARVGNPVAWLMQNRAAHLRPFVAFLQQVLSPASPNPRIRALVEQLAINALAGPCGLPTQNPRPVPEGLDPRYNDPTDWLPLLFEIIFEDVQLLNQWMRLLDEHVARSSSANLSEMDQNARTLAAPVRKDIVLVGGGPLTSILASILGAFYRVTVITQERGLGKPWRNRRGIRINSSCTIKDVFAPGLPLLGGATTRVTASGQWGLDVDALLSRETLTVRCDNGSTVSYALGSLLGALVATIISFHADDYLQSQRVDIAAMARNVDGSLRLSLVDVERGVERLLDADAVFLLTGPAREKSKVDDARSRTFYRSAAEQVDRAVREARRDLDLELAEQRELERAFPGEDARAFRQTRLRAEVTRIARLLQLGLPRLLTLSAMEKLAEIWEELSALGADPSSFPLADLISADRSIAYIGDGDTARTLKEWVDQAAGFFEPRGTLYNEQAQSPDEYARTNRRRYRGVFTSNTSAIPYKVARYRLTVDRAGRPRVEVTHRDASGQRRRRSYDYIFDATGLDTSRVEDLLPPQFRMTDFFDLEGLPVGRRDRTSNLYILGVAAGLQGADFPLDIRRILTALGIEENVLALWANGLLAERAAYTFATARRPTKAAPPAGV